MDHITVNVDGQDVEVEAGSTVLQACEEAGAEIPRFCYHERLQIAGNCRMCLVEVEGGPPKPAASCAMPAMDGMKVHTNTPMVKKAREGVMEFLLINHPLDCPICDQGGECDLQDQAMAYGRGYTRYTEDKRAVEEKQMGPLIKTQMTRCIHCTRCVRFAEEIAGVPEIGAINRGEHMEITTYLNQTVSSELSGNVIDLCPVGALTSRPYAFKGRPWELSHTESVDVMDAVGSNIRIDSRGREVMRVLPRLHEEINEEWISDKTRFACDGLKVQRLDRPMVRKDGNLQEVNWDEALSFVAETMQSLKPKEIGAITGDLVDAEAMFTLKGLMDEIGSPNLDCRQDGAKLDATVRASYLFNTTIAGVEEADFCLLVGTNPRAEASLLNARLRKRYLQGGFTVANVGPQLDLTFPIEELGNDLSKLEEALDEHTALGKRIAEAKRPMIILGMAPLMQDGANALLAKLHEIVEKYQLMREDWRGFNLLHTAASRVAGLDMGFVPGKGGKNVPEMIKACQAGEIKMLYLLGADEIDTSKLGDAFVVYQGHHGDRGAHRADVIFPGAAYTEKNGLYVNMEGRVQEALRAIAPPGDAKEDWKILRALSQVAGHKLPYDNLDQLRAKMVEAVPHFAAVDHIEPAEWKHMGRAGKLSAKPLKLPIDNFYMTDPISRASRTMAECSKNIADADEERRAA